MSKKQFFSSAVPQSLLIVSVIAGTGSTYGTENPEKWIAHIQKRIPFSSEKRSCEELDVRTALDHLENIRAVFNPPISDLANLLDVSRQAVYKWLAQDSTPEPSKLLQITAISKAADDFKKAGISRANTLVNMKAFDGKSLLQLLKAGLDYKQIEILIAEGKAMEAAYQRSGIKHSQAKPTHDWLSDISIPAYLEDI